MDLRNFIGNWKLSEAGATPNIVRGSGAYPGEAKAARTLRF